MITAHELLKIDEEHACASTDEHLHTLCAQHGVNGVVAGLSGGIDSAVLFGLAVRSLGESAVHAMYLYDRDNEWSQGSNARRVADWLKIDLEIQSIETDICESRSNTSWVIRMARLSPLFNRFIYRLYAAVAKETPFVSSLRAGDKEIGDRQASGTVIGVVHQLANELFYVRHRYRREILESKAKAHNWLLLGSANRSEWEIGWFVRGGVDDLPYQPLIGLYKTQVRQLACYLGVPDVIRQQAPSADMMRGVSDEYALGVEYTAIDLVLDYLSAGVSREDLSAAGVTENDIRRVREMKELSGWKRRTIPGPPPIDGSRSGGLRVS